MPLTLPQVTRAYSSRFDNIYLFLTERCQLRCGHCYMGDRLDHGQQFSTAGAIRTLQYWQRMGARFLTLVGGEPTLHPGLSEVVEAATASGYEKIVIDTNALFTHNLLRVSPQLLYCVRVSLDGATPETHDRVRGRGNYAKVLQGIRQLRDAGYTVRLTSTVFRFNQHEALSVILLAEQLGISVVNFHSFTPEGLGAANRDWALAPLEWCAFCVGLEQDAAGSSVEVRYPPTWATPDQLPAYAARGFQGCLGCTLDRLSVFPDGRCYVCSVLFDHPVHFGMMTEDGFALNTKSEQNEFELFTRAAVRAEDPLHMGCPADELNGLPNGSGAGLVSVCRLWRATVARPISAEEVVPKPIPAGNAKVAHEQ